MRILADENMDRDVVLGLRAYDHDVRWATTETDRSELDANLLELGTQERRTVITYDYDTDFGELICRDNVPAPYGVILFRIHDDVPKDVKRLFVVSTITSWDAWPPSIWTIQIRHTRKAA